jgi:hypothetical protein
MRRVVLILLTTVSCCVLCACAWMWVRSYRVAEGLAWDDASGRRRELVSYAGAVHVRELTGLPATSARRTPIREDVPEGADWKTRCGGNLSIVWQGGGFVVASGSTQVILLTSLSYPVHEVGGFVRTSFAPNVPVASQPVVVSGMTIAAADALVIQSGGGLTASGNVTITGGGVPAAMLTAQNVVFSPSFASTWQLAVVVPYWAVVTLASLLPVYCLAKVPGALQRRRRIRRGLCVHCGYDMRASSDRCPECGTPASEATST